MNPLRTLHVAAFLSAASLVSLPGFAAEPGASADRLAAEALFNEARMLLAQGKYEEACPKFAASHRLDPAVGTLLNLGECYERRGQTASAWLQYREAAALAPRKGNDDRRAKLARDKAALLEAKLAMLTVRAPASVQVKRDGATLDGAVLGSPVPVDPGSHVIEASAPGKKPWKHSVLVDTAARVVVDVPPLETDAPRVEEAAPPVIARPEAPRTDHGEPGSGQRTAAYIVGGTGVLGLGLGVAFGLVARSRWSGVNDVCPGGHCPDAATRAAQASSASAASDAATAATAGFAAAGALLVGGAVLYFTAHSAGKQVARVVPALGPGGVGVALTQDLP